MINNEIIGISIAFIVFAIVLAFIIYRLKKEHARQIEELKGQFNTANDSLLKTVQEWDLQRKLDIRALQETTVKAYEASGELIITSPDGKTKIDEFKIKKGA